MNIYEKLMNIQNELKAPKGQYNSFGKYKYRSCEDILEAVKPLLKQYNCVLVLNDELVNIGERYYIKATAEISDTEISIESKTNFNANSCEFESYLKTSTICNTAYAREELEKKGMDGSQITGTASSYARKYALNGLFLIDDTKDADTDEFTNQTKDEPKITSTMEEGLRNAIKDNKIDNDKVIKVLAKFNCSKLAELKASQVVEFRKMLEE